MKLAKLRVFATYDGKLSVFLTPFCFMHVGQALRAWDEVCMDGKSMMSKHPSDFVLYEIGEFDDDKGVITPHNPIRQIATALEVATRAKSNSPELSIPGSAVRFEN